MSQWWNDSHSQLEECWYTRQSKFWLVLHEPLQCGPSNLQAAYRTETFPPRDHACSIWILKAEQETAIRFVWLCINSIWARCLHKHLTHCSLIFPVIPTAAFVFWEVESTVREITAFQHVLGPMLDPHVVQVWNPEGCRPRKVSWVLKDV